MKILFFLCFLLIPSVFGFEFIENTTYKQNNINFHFSEGIVVDSFKIISDGILINDKHRLSFIVLGGMLDVYFYEWSDKNNKIGFQGSAPQDLIFKITVNNERRYLKRGETYFIDSIPIDTDITIVSYVKYFESDTSDTIKKTIHTHSWYEKKFIEVEYDTQKDNLTGIIEGKTIGMTYLWMGVVFITISVLFWVFK